MENPIEIPEAHIIRNEEIYAINITPTNGEISEYPELVIIHRPRCLEKTLVCLHKIYVSVFMFSFAFFGIGFIFFGMYYRY